MKKTNWVAALLLATVSSVAGEFRLETAGGRFGFSANKRTRDLHLADAEATCNLPWAWKPGLQWRIQTGLEFTAGALYAPGPDAFLGTAGPIVSLGWIKFPVSLELGLSPTFLSRQVVGRTDFGSQFHFTTHAGLNWDIGSHFRVGYRFQHMSNGGLTEHNPGLNLHIFSASYHF